MIEHGIRRRLEAREDNLSRFAQRSSLSNGRKSPEEPSLMRTDYQRDRDRIIHSKSFRRLKHKTQVFIAPTGDHYVTRLTHTIEVSQVARTIARSLNLNEDLTEAIALAHDLGHSPFGHLGEEALNELHPDGFAHAEQSLRVVDCLENNGTGLNLTYEVKQGILNHSKPRSSLKSLRNEPHQTLEGQICRLSDAIAYINHDMDDAIRARIIQESDLPNSIHERLGKNHRERLNTLITNIVEESWDAAGETSHLGSEPPHIKMSSRIEETVLEMREFLFQKVYLPNGRGTAIGEEAWQAVMALYDHYSKHPDEIPSEYGTTVENVNQRTVDYISGMTDTYALKAYKETRNKKHIR
ncbi:MAG: deoxyguanosinetriphosphate triphosphohydrolase [SAR202 cluster bacterium]|nr:deoxyguanosinetriphosphate triphosphohydrolase [SAR202 cluster bacterium]|tara:strand:+ start:7043 stop:8104 length:1062 start_codon:yes stop_codon:yes gene_type:complete